MVVSFRLTKLEMIIIINVYILYCRLQSIRTEEKPAEHRRIDCAARRSGRKKGLANERHQQASSKCWWQMMMMFLRGGITTTTVATWTAAAKLLTALRYSRGREWKEDVLVARRRRREQDFELKININLCVLTLCKHDERASSDRPGAATQRWQCTLRIARTLVRAAQVQFWSMNEWTNEDNCKIKFPVFFSHLLEFSSQLENTEHRGTREWTNKQINRGKKTRPNGTSLSNKNSIVVLQLIPHLVIWNKQI